MPIYLANTYEEMIILKITGNDEVRLHLKNLGFNVGEKVMVLQKVNDNIIVKVKGITIGIGRDLAKRILV